MPDWSRRRFLEGGSAAAAIAAVWRCAPDEPGLADDPRPSPGESQPSPDASRTSPQAPLTGPRRPLAAPAALLMASRDGRGTNALLRMPPDAFPSRFGRDSLRRHLAEARRARVPATVLSNPRFGLDLDGPADLVRFWNREGGAATRSYLAGSGVITRLAEKGWNLGE